MTFVDSRYVPDGSSVTTDLCIVGAGAAGISIASEMIGDARRVLLLESGGLEPDAETQALYGGENVGFSYYPPGTVRLRFFGGTTNHWTGACRPLDEVDFQTRSWVPYSGWPIQRHDLELYYRRAHSLCDLGPMNYDPGLWDNNGAPPLDLDLGSLETVMYRMSPPTRFGEKFRGRLASESNVTTYLHGNAVDVVLDASGRQIDRLRVRCLSGSEFTVRASTFVLATGAIENARLLLHWMDQGSLRLDRTGDWVGRTFMEHLSLVGGTFLPSRSELDTALYERRPSLGGYIGYGVLAPVSDTMEREKILHAKVHLTPASVPEGLKSVAPGLVGSVVAAESGGLFDQLGTHIGNVISEIDELAIYSYERMFRSSGGQSAYYLNYHLEHAPNRHSRVTLSEERDPLGIPRVRVAWRFGELERRTLRGMNRLIAAEVGAAGLGRVQEAPNGGETGWPVGLRGAWHQMGTTRMSATAAEGVVDGNGRMHEVENLFVAGSSVFPTSGHANPTLTIVALALRMAEHLKGIQT